MIKEHDPGDTHTPSKAIKDPSSCNKAPLYPFFNSAIRYAHRININTTAALKNPIKILKDLGSVPLSTCASFAFVYLQANSRDRPMNMQSVRTWKDSPAMDMSTAGPLPPLDVEESAPPTDCRTRERMSHGMKNQ